MKLFKQVFAVVLCVALLCSASVMGATVSADEAKTVVDGIRWFPCEEGRENDDIWEVECVQDGCGCQRFTDVPEETGNTNFLDTVYGEDGSLTITRNGADGNDSYWPRIRTLMLENYPELDLKVANTLYFDFTAHEGTSWNIMLGINGMSIKLSKVISDACGVTSVANSDADGVAGTYKGSINLQDAIASIATESGTESSTFAVAMQNMKTTYVPQLQIFCVGAVGASITINEMFISTAEDTTGANCDYLDMGLVYGDEIYTLGADEGGEDAGDVEGGDPADTETEPSEDETDTTTTTKAKTDKAEPAGSNTGLIVGIIVAVVVIAAIVVVVIVMKKKKA